MLPAMERMGKTAQLLLAPEQVMLVQLQDDGAEGCLVKMELPTVRPPTCLPVNCVSCIAFGDAARHVREAANGAAEAGQCQGRTADHMLAQLSRARSHKRGRGGTRRSSAAPHP